MFTLAVIPDPQIASQQYPELTQNIVTDILKRDAAWTFVVGDLTEWGDRLRDWNNIKSALDRLPRKTVASGNHDDDFWDNRNTSERYTGPPRYDTFNRYFPTSGMNGFLEAMPANRSGNVVQAAIIGGIDFRLMTLNFNPTDAELAWLDAMLVKYAAYPVILTTHEYLRGSTRTTVGDRIWVVIRKHANVFLTFSGHHYPYSGYLKQRTDKGTQVVSIMADYQSYDAKDPNGYYALLECDPDKGTIKRTTYSPTLSRYMTGSAHEHTITGVDFPPALPGGTPVARPTADETRALADRIEAFVRKWYSKQNQISRGSSYRATEEGGGTWSHHNGQYHNGSNTAAIDFSEADAVTGSYPGGGATAAMRDFAKWWFDNFGDLTVQEFHTTPYDDDIGFNIVEGRKNTGDVPGHANHVHLAMSSALMNQADTRAQQKWGGTPTPAPTPAPTPEPAPTTTVQFGLDLYDFTVNAGLTEDHVRGFVRTGGIAFMNAKFTEFDGSTVYEHKQAARMLRAATAEGLKFPMGFVVPRTGPSVDAQIDKLLAFADREFPQWKTHPGFSWQVDLEHWDYDKVAPSIGTEMAKRLMVRTQKPALLYAAPWAYGNTVPNYPGRKLWASNYDGSGVSRDYRVMYTGDSAPGWRAYSGSVPTINQYCSDGKVNGYGPLVMSAFRGTEADFRTMLADAVRPYLTTPAPTNPIADAMNARALEVKLNDLWSNEMAGTSGYVANAPSRRTQQILTIEKALAALAGEPAPSGVLTMTVAEMSARSNDVKVNDLWTQNQYGTSGYVLEKSPSFMQSRLDHIEAMITKLVTPKEPS